MIKKESGSEKVPSELFNEKQETFFDTKLSTAADNFTKAHLEIEGWKKKKAECEKILIVEMHRTKQACLNLPDNKQIRVAITSMKLSFSAALNFPCSGSTTR